MAKKKKEPTPPDAGKGPTLSVNRHYEALLVNDGWYVRSKHTKGAWKRAILQTARVCADLHDGKVLPSDRLQIVL